jgi:hypothetical protein
MQEKVPINSNLAESLTRLAKEKHAECCHEVATSMQDAFNLAGKTATIYEIYSGDCEMPNHLLVMDVKVRNHYITVVDDKAYNSSTGPNGVPVEISMQRLQDENENPLLMIGAKEFKGDHNES